MSVYLRQLEHISTARSVLQDLFLLLQKTLPVHVFGHRIRHIADHAGDGAFDVLLFRPHQQRRNDADREAQAHAEIEIVVFHPALPFRRSRAAVFHL